MSTDPSTNYGPDRPPLPPPDPPDEAETATRLPVDADPPSVSRTRHVGPGQLARRPPVGPTVPIIPGYEIEGELGRGSMGVVYRARHVELNRTVALKMVLSGPHASQGDRERFRSEAEAVAALDHPNVVRIHEIGEHDGMPFFTLEFCAGGTLADRCKAGPMPPRAAAVMMEKIARGVACAHAHGIVHRDLKPGNVLLGEDGTPRVTDFGLAKKLDANDGMTETGAVMGTPLYMAPEQAGGGAKRVGPAGDVWSLGAILYRMVAGEVPFKGETSVDTLRRVIDQEPPRPRAVNPGVPRDLEVICLKCLNKDPGKRYLSADALAEDLRRFTEGLPIKARPVGQAERSWKWLKRNPAAGLGALALAAAAGISIGFALRAERARELAERQSELARANERLAEAVRDFMRFDILNQADPAAQAERKLELGGAEFRVDPDLTLREALDHAAAGLTEGKIGRRFPGEPLLQAAILQTVGDTYRALGETDKAIEHLKRAGDLREGELGEGHRDTLACRNGLALAYLTSAEAGRKAKAIPLFERTLELRERHQGDLAPDTIEARHNLASAYLKAGDETQRGKAIPLLEGTLGQFAAVLGEGHPDTFTCRNTLASAYEVAGRFDDAIPLVARTLQYRRTTLAEGHPLIATSVNNLAVAYFRAGRLAEAAPLFKEALEKSEASRGPDHPVTLILRDNLALSYRGSGEHDGAIPLYQANLNYKELAAGGEDTPATLGARSNLALAYSAASRHDEAIPLLEESLRRCVAKFDPNHPLAVSLRNDLGGVYQAAKKMGEAVEQFERAYGSVKEGGFKHPRSLTIQHNLINGYFLTERFEEQETVLAERFELMKGWVTRSGNSEHDRMIVEAKIQHGACLIGLGRHAEAEAALREGLQLGEQVMPDSWQTASTRSTLGEALLEQGRLGEAETLLTAGQDGLERASAWLDSDDLLRRSADRLARLYEANGRSDEAERWRAESERLSADGRR